jgi:hypothetical protein
MGKGVPFFNKKKEAIMPAVKEVVKGGESTITTYPFLLFFQNLLNKCFSFILLNKCTLFDICYRLIIE